MELNRITSLTKEQILSMESKDLNVLIQEVESVLQSAKDDIAQTTFQIQSIQQKIQELSESFKTQFGIDLTEENLDSIKEKASADLDQALQKVKTLSLA